MTIICRNRRGDILSTHTSRIEASVTFENRHNLPHKEAYYILRDDVTFCYPNRDASFRGDYLETMEELT